MATHQIVYHMLLLLHRVISFLTTYNGSVSRPRYCPLREESVQLRSSLFCLEEFPSRLLGYLFLMFVEFGKWYSFCFSNYINFCPNLEQFIMFTQSVMICLSLSCQGYFFPQINSIFFIKPRQTVTKRFWVLGKKYPERDVLSG